MLQVAVGREAPPVSGSPVPAVADSGLRGRLGVLSGIPYSFLWDVEAH